MADEIYTVLNRLQTESFVRSVTLEKNSCPTVILFEEEQLEMNKTFCFDTARGSVGTEFRQNYIQPGSSICNHVRLHE